MNNFHSFNLYIRFFICVMFIYLLSFHNLTAEETTPTVVKLATESSLAPLYLLPLHNEGSLEEVYAAQLEKIFSFDLNHNGATYVVKRTAAKDQIGSRGETNQLGSLSAWKDNCIFYVVKPHIQEKSIRAVILDVHNKSIKMTEEFPLIGDLSQDRRQVHRMSDVVHKALFGTDGIASTRILYTVKTENSPDSSKWVSEVWEADYDGGNAQQITNERSYCVTPVYLPPKPGFNTGAFMYVSYQLGQPKIFVCSLKDGKRRRLSYVRGNQLMPAISLQRDKVAFICDITGNPDLFLQPFSPEQGAIGKPQQIFSARQATQGTPTFSPDGTRIAFVSDKDGSPKIYVIQIPNAGASIKDIQATLISKNNRENSAPSWSPDGTKLAYCARTKGDRQIWVYDFTTRQEKQVTQGSGHKENPSWAPNSLHLAYNTSELQSSALYITHLNQSESVQITFGKEEKRFPNWEPRITKKVNID